MKKIAELLHLIVATVLILGASSGCRLKNNKASHLLQADRYFQSSEYDKAEIEYLNVLQTDSQNVVAISRLGIIYFEQGRLARAVPFLLRARGLEPNTIESRIKLGAAYLSAGKRKEAREEAMFVLTKEPDNTEASLLLAKAVASPTDAEAARLVLNALPAPSIADRTHLVALGTLDAAAGRFKEAEEIFRRAETLDPKSAPAKAALSAVYWSQKDLVRAEQTLVGAAELSAGRSPVKIQLIQFRLQKGDREEARRELEKISQEFPDWLTPLLLSVEVALSNNEFERSEALIEKILTREANLPEVSLLSARVKLGKGDTATAISEFEKLLKLHPQNVHAHYYLAQALLVTGEVTRAITSLNQAISLAPTFAEAVVLLAGVNITKGDLNSAIIVLKPLIQQRPDLAQPRLLLAEAYRRKNDLDQALVVYRELEQAFPGNPQTSWLAGLVLVQKNNKAEAKQFFEHAVELQPTYLPAVEQLVNLDLGDARYTEARERIEKQITANPKSAAPYLLLAHILVAQKQTDEAESALQKAIALEPSTPNGYLMLARLYIDSHQQQKALANLKEVIAKNPKEVTALMLMGAIYDEEKNTSGAIDSYEKLLAINPKFSAALNNLAYLYSEQAGQLDKAFDLAKRARELLPTEPNTADTLGWILYKRRQYSWAVSLLTESARGLPTNPQVNYHLGMVHYRLGNEHAAAVALQHAVGLSADFPGSDEAKRALATLTIDSEKAGPAEETQLKQGLTLHPDDPVALTRLASIYERQNNDQKAFESYEAALKQAPENSAILLKSAEFQRRRNNPEKALELLKLARKQDPENPEIAHALGRVAYQTGNYRWAHGLLQESAARQSENPETSFDLALAAYGVGRAAEAETALKTALSAKDRFGNRAQAEQFLEMLLISQNPSVSTEADESVAKVLHTDPTNLAALMAKGAIGEYKKATGPARVIYQQIIDSSPAFTPALKRLAFLLAEAPAELQKASDLATKAREDLPQDNELTKLLGIIAYRQGQFEKASNLLKQSSFSRVGDSELMYYYGRAQAHLKDYTGAQQSLQRALDLNLRTDLAIDAKKVLESLKQ